MGLALVLVTVAAALFIGVGWLSLLGKLPPNGAVGIRTPFTRESDDNWYATHRAAAPILIFGGVAALMAGVAFLPFTLAGKVSNGLAGAVCLAIAFVLVTAALASWVVGTRSARAQLSH
jgi:uncharacterized membrane protein